MKVCFFIFAVTFTLGTSTASALELKNPEPDHGRLSIELEVVPIPPQKDFEQYVQEQVTAAQRDAKDAGSKPDEQLATKKQPKPLNPVTLFRW
jgi:hypothetical protein